MRIACCLLLLFLPGLASAQLTSIAPGSKLRVYAPGFEKERIVGTLMAPIDSVAAIALPLRRTSRDSPWHAELRSIPVTSIRRLEISRGRSHGRGAKRGAAIGALGSLALVLGGVYVDVTQKDPDSLIPASAAAVIFSVLIVPSTTLLGAVIGVERWEQAYRPGSP